MSGEREPLPVPGPRAFEVRVYGHLCAYRLHTGDRVTIDPDAPLDSGALVLAVLHESTDFPLASLAIYFNDGTEEFLDVERAVAADGARHGHTDRYRGEYRVVGPALLVNEALRRPLVSHLSHITGAPPDLNVPAPPWHFDDEALP